jgi:ubiquinol-cytochrome c reductase cytochrome b subunit
MKMLAHDLEHAAGRTAGRAAGGAGRWFDDRLGAAHFGRKAVNKVFPDHWSFMLGEIAFYCFLVLVATGVYLTLFFEPRTHRRCR